MCPKGIVAVLSIAIAACLATEGNNYDQYLRFGRENYNGYMRFGRSGPPLDIDTDNIPVTFLGQDYFQRINRQEPDPFLRFGRKNAAYLPGPDPFLRIGRSSQYMRFGKREFPYLRFGRDYIPRNDAADLILSLQKSGSEFVRPDIEYPSLTGTLDYGQDFGGRKKRSVNTKMEETNPHSILGLTLTDNSETVPVFKNTESKVLDGQNTREARGGSQYMRFGKKNRLEDYGNNNSNLDKKFGSSAGGESEKRRNEYMRFGRGPEYMRFGRGHEYMRFGRAPEENLS